MRGPAAILLRTLVAGRLPPVCYVEANGNYQSEENPQDTRLRREPSLHDVARACMHSPQRGKLAMAVNYDEHGGYYDHVVPLPAVPQTTSHLTYTSRPRGPIRRSSTAMDSWVPFVVASRWGRPDYVSHRVMDHTSVLAFIEHQWNLPPMTHRDARAWDMRDMLDFSRPRMRTIDLPAPPSISKTTARCKAHGKNPPTPKPTPKPTPVATP